MIPPKMLIGNANARFTIMMSIMIFSSPISIASLVTLTMLRPTKQIFRPNSMQLSTTC